MFDSPFERKIKKLASESGLKIADLKSSGARFLFNVSGHTQPLFVIPYGELWELSCPTIVALDDLDDFPQFILAIALKTMQQTSAASGASRKSVARRCLNICITYQKPLSPLMNFTRPAGMWLIRLRGWKTLSEKRWGYDGVGLR